jgi:predicted nucleotidyltransferase
MITVKQPTLTIPQDELARYCRTNGIQSLAMFGSQVTGQSNPESDVDLLVEFDPDARIGFLALARMQRELTDLFQKSVDLVPRQGLKKRIRDRVLAEAIEIYATG